jgi:hypothetical protein
MSSPFSIILVLNASTLSVCTPIDRNKPTRRTNLAICSSAFHPDSGLPASTSSLFVLPRRSQSSSLTLVISSFVAEMARKYI